MQSRLSLSVSRVRCTQPSAGAPSRFLTVAILAVLCAGCAVTLISPYDEQIDRGATDLQAQALLQIHRNTTQTVLLTIEGLGVIAVENAINAALSAVATAVNKAAGLALL